MKVGHNKSARKKQLNLNCILLVGVSDLSLQAFLEGTLDDQYLRLQVKRNRYA